MSTLTGGGRTSPEPHVDAEAALDAARETVDGPLYAFGGHSLDRVSLLYVSDDAVDRYGDPDELREQLHDLAGYVQLDYPEHELFADSLVPFAGEIDHVVQTFDDVALVRVYAGDGGVFALVAAAEPVERLVTAVAEAL